MYIDSHAHFDIILSESPVTENDLIDALEKHSISHAVQVSIEPSGFQWSHEFARRHRDAGILFTLGIHPSSRAVKSDLDAIRTYTSKIVNSADSGLLFGIGECGLDFYRMHQTKEMQRSSFEFQIALAKEYNLPVIVHSRDAMDETLEILQKYKPLTGIMHCFPGNRAAAKKVIDLGFYISFAGNVTYKKAFDLHESGAYVPLDRLLLETDAPFLSPVPVRGEKNRSEYVVHTYKFIADLRRIPLSAVTDAVTANFKGLLKN